jgi:hypothetical protein
VSEELKYFIRRIFDASIWPVEAAGCLGGKPGKQEAV